MTLRRIIPLQTNPKILIISAGAMLGANARYWLSCWAATKWGAGFPYGSMLINLSGSFLLGLFMTLATERDIVDPRWRMMAATGFLGAYTTFSTLSHVSFYLRSGGQWLNGLLYMLGSAIAGLVFVALGVLIGRL
jgi:CrcB protein